jgi:hypothetical protein
MNRTRAIIERAHYNTNEHVLREKEMHVNEEKKSLAQLRQRRENWKVTQMKCAHLSTLRYLKKKHL